MERMLRKLVICLCSIISCFELWAVGETPYSVFGNDTEAMDIDHTKYLRTADIYMVSGDSTAAVMSIRNGSLTIKSANGVVIVIDSISPSDRARYLTGDPKAVEMPHVSPYSFCYGNSAGYLDPSGQKPNEYEAALMSQAAYLESFDNDQDPIKTLIDLNWFVVQPPGDIKMDQTGFWGNGLKSVLFQKSVDGVATEYVCAFAGTNSIKDVFADIYQLVGVSRQYASAINNAKKLDEVFGGTELTFVGHSKGAGEAAASSMATGRAAVTFNPAAVSPLTKLVHGLGDAVNVTNYRTIGVQTSIPGLRVGGCVVNNIQDNLGMSAPGTTYTLPIGLKNPFKAHSIDPIVDYLKSQQ